MKKLLYTLALLISFVSYSQESNLDWILTKMKNNSTEAYNILKMYSDLPQKLSYASPGGSVTSTTKSSDAYFYLDLSSKKTTLNSMGTNVHEICHGLTSSYFYKEMKTNHVPHDFRDIGSYFYISEEIDYVSVFKGKVFPSSDLQNVIPKSLITSRYDTYILGNNSTQGEGLIGLLNEFNAYYHGSKFDFDMLSVYKEIYPNDYLNEWVMNLQSEMTAFYEFDLWIKEYLIHAKYNYPSLYTVITDNSSVIDIYKAIHKKYKLLIEKYSSVVNFEKTKMKYNYKTEFWQDDYFKLIKELSNPKFDFINSLL
jgi:hypothetical protein